MPNHIMTIYISNKLLTKLRKEAPGLGWSVGGYVKNLLEWSLTQPLDRLKPAESHVWNELNHLSVAMPPGLIREIDGVRAVRKWRSRAATIRALFEQFSEKYDPRST